MRFKRLRIIQNNKEIILDDYYLEGEFTNYTFCAKQNDGSVIHTYNTNCCSIFDKNKFKNVIANKLDTRYWVSKEPLNGIIKTRHHFCANEVIEFEFYDNE